MKVTDINLDQLLYTEPVKSQPYDSPEEEGGFFKKVFAKKKEPEVPFFNTRVEEFGRDEIYNDLMEGYDAYYIQGAPFETMVVLTSCYLILPGREIFPLYDVERFALKNEYAGNRKYEQYAIDRKGIPYDPAYVSEFEGEESFELDRFNVLLQITDENHLLYEYVIKMEVPDRKDFRARLIERLEVGGGAIDLSEEDAIEGLFVDDSDTW